MIAELHQEHRFHAPAARLFDALMDPAKVAVWTTVAQTEIDPTEGGRFSLMAGRVVGRFIELEKDRRIVQAWRSFDWSPGLYSMVRIELVPEADTTRVIFDQFNFPEQQRDHLDDAWRALYWVPLGRYLSGQPIEAKPVADYWRES